MKCRFVISLLLAMLMLTLPCAALDSTPAGDDWGSPPDWGPEGVPEIALVTQSMTETLEKNLVLGEDYTYITYGWDIYDQGQINIGVANDENVRKAVSACQDPRVTVIYDEIKWTRINGKNYNDVQLGQASERLYNMLEEKLDPQDYAGMMNYAPGKIQIWAVNEGKVRTAVKACKEPLVQVTYRKAKFSLFRMRRVAKTVENLACMKDFPGEVEIYSDGVHIRLMEDNPELYRWLKTYKYKDVIAECGIYMKKDPGTAIEGIDD